MACWPIQYFTALSIAHQSPGCFPKAVYIVIQMIRKRTPAERRGNQ